MSVSGERPQRGLVRMRNEQNLILSSCRSVLTSKTDTTPPTSPDNSRSTCRFGASVSSICSFDDILPPPMLPPGTSSSFVFPECGSFGDFAVFSDDEIDVHDDGNDEERLRAKWASDNWSTKKGPAATGGGEMLHRCDTSFNSKSNMINMRSMTYGGDSKKALPLQVDSVKAKLNGTACQAKRYVLMQQESASSRLKKDKLKSRKSKGSSSQRVLEAAKSA
jgi:hypothetical protein